MTSFLLCTRHHCYDNGISIGYASTSHVQMLGWPEFRVSIVEIFYYSQLSSVRCVNQSASGGMTVYLDVFYIEIHTPNPRLNTSG